MSTSNGGSNVSGVGFSSSVETLAAPTIQAGGLLRRKDVDAATAITFAQPASNAGASSTTGTAARKSMLGLDKLAEDKREERKRKLQALSFDIEQDTTNDDGGGSMPDDGAEWAKRRKRHYRSFVPETPTHTGGVNRDALDRIDRRQREQRDRRSIVDERHQRDRESDRSSDRDRDRERDHDRDRERDRDRDRYRDDRDYRRRDDDFNDQDRDRSRGGGRSDRSGRADAPASVRRDADGFALPNSRPSSSSGSSSSWQLTPRRDARYGDAAGSTSSRSTTRMTTPRRPNTLYNVRPRRARVRARACATSLSLSLSLSRTN